MTKECSSKAHIISIESWDESLYDELSCLSAHQTSIQGTFYDKNRIQRQLLGPSLSSLEVKRENGSLLEVFLAIDIQRQCLKAAFKSLERLAARYTSRQEFEALEKLFFQSNSEILSQAINSAHQQMKKEFETTHASRNKSTALILGIEREVLKILWRIARSLVEEKEYEYAYQILFLLLALEPLIIEAWLSYGYVNHQMKSYNTALNAYLTARHLACDTVSSHLLFIADCYVDMDCPDDADSYLKEFAARIENDRMMGHHDSQIFLQAISLYDSIKEKLNVKLSELRKRGGG